MTNDMRHVAEEAVECIVNCGLNQSEAEDYLVGMFSDIKVSIFEVLEKELVPKLAENVPADFYRGGSALAFSIRTRLRELILLERDRYQPEKERRLELVEDDGDAPRGA